MHVSFSNQQNAEYEQKTKESRSQCAATVQFQMVYFVRHPDGPCLWHEFMSIESWQTSTRPKLYRTQTRHCEITRTKPKHYERWDFARLQFDEEKTKSAYDYTSNTQTTPTLCWFVRCSSRVLRWSLRSFSKRVMKERYASWRGFFLITHCCLCVQTIDFSSDLNSFQRKSSLSFFFSSFPHGYDRSDRARSRRRTRVSADTVQLVHSSVLLA